MSDFDGVELLKEARDAVYDLNNAPYRRYIDLVNRIDLYLADNDILESASASAQVGEK